MVQTSYRHLVLAIQPLGRFWQRSPWFIRFGLVYLTAVGAFLLTEMTEEWGELQAGRANIFSAVELLLFLMTVGGAVQVFRLLLRERRERALAQAQLAHVRTQLDHATEHLKDGKAGFAELIRWQFSEWQLTPSEQEVAHLLLKGLSFREIADARGIKEKTARHQATGIYTKSGLNGRNELAAWFFEDLL